MMLARRRATISGAIVIAASIVILTAVLASRSHFRHRTSATSIPSSDTPGQDTPDTSTPLQSGPVPLTAVQNASQKDAVCLDGSTPHYHFEKGSGRGADNWIVFLEGGAWCRSLDDCLDRSRTSLGSSQYMDLMEFDGILSPQASHNPDFYNWNRVMVRYCDGASFAGDVEGEVQHNGEKLFFRGQHIWQAVMMDLSSKGLAHAKQAFLTGDSAGGLATLLHCDNFHELLPKVGTIKCLSDAGFFLNIKDISGKGTLHSLFKDVVSLQNVEKSLQKDCLSTTDATQCFFPPEIIKHITTPVFILNSPYDPIQIQNVLVPDSSDPQQKWQSCKQNVQACDAKQLKVLQGFRATMLDNLKDFQNSQQEGMYINSCFAHYQTMDNNRWHSPNSPRINNKTIAESVGDWYFNRREVKDVDCAYPCNHTCDD